LPLKGKAAAETLCSQGSALGKIAVAPVRMLRPSTFVTCETITPGTSVIPLKGPDGYNPNLNGMAAEALVPAASTSMQKTAAKARPMAHEIRPID
jgi:hypothetical protein